ncbi:hypothetical protein HNY73_000560 [Argiope bruennichi]|uniref:Uncharacterized protein n=1 Tax=Argiope bruennichi TaxID=94029 RepID=A0A8T0FZP8_ARGBR|nr:hypothetical protein HNY73_000560 [Argiope bruennichi]
MSGCFMRRSTDRCAKMSCHVIDMVCMGRCSCAGLMCCVSLCIDAWHGGKFMVMHAVMHDCGMMGHAWMGCAGVMSACHVDWHWGIASRYMWMMRGVIAMPMRYKLVIGGQVVMVMCPSLARAYFSHPRSTPPPHVKPRKGTRDSPVDDSGDATFLAGIIIGGRVRPMRAPIPLGTPSISSDGGSFTPRRWEVAGSQRHPPKGCFAPTSPKSRSRQRRRTESAPCGMKSKKEQRASIDRASVSRLVLIMSLSEASVEVLTGAVPMAEWI